MASEGSVEMCLELLRGMQDAVAGSRKSFLGGNTCVIDREYLLGSLSQLERNLPKAVEKAVQVVKNATAIEEQARTESEAKLRDASAQAQRTVQEAQSKAQQLMQDAQTQSATLTAATERDTQEKQRKAQEEATAYIAAARADAQRIVEDAQRHAAMLVAQEEIVRRARVEANETKETAQQELETVRQNTFDYLDSLLGNVDRNLTDLVGELRMERNELNARR